ncbi:hypothetical protein V6N13_010773 [Hibiscus sabdariffa]
MSKVERPASAYRSMASTASSRSILPQAPLVCHMPLRTLHMSSESFPFFTVICRAVASSVAAVADFEQHFTELGLSCCLDPENRVEVMSLVEFLDWKRLRLGKMVDEAIFGTQKCLNSKTNEIPGVITLRCGVRLRLG